MKNKKGKKADAQLKKRIIKFFIPFVMLLMIIIIGTAAWFTMNKETETGGLGMASVYVPFEVASYGGDGNYDYLISDYSHDDDKLDNALDVYYYDNASSEWKKDENGVLAVKDDKSSFLSRITGKHNAVKWQVGEQSNFANYSSKKESVQKPGEPSEPDSDNSSGQESDSDSDNQSGASDQEQSPDSENEISDVERYEYMLEPGDSGYLEFYVIPKKDGDLNLKFTLDIDMFRSKGSGTLNPEDALRLEDSDTATGQQYLRHHLLFFRDYNEEINEETNEKTVRYSGMLGYDSQNKIIDFDDDHRMTFTDEIKDAVKDSAYRYRIYWIWPNILGQTILSDKEKDILSDCNPAIFEDGNDEKTAFISAMKEHPEYFLNVDADAENEKKLNLTELVESVTATRSDTESGHTDNNHEDYYLLSYCWNRADQYIGLHISCITAEMIVNSNN